MATAQGKQGIWFLLFPDGKHREFGSDHRENIWTVIINVAGTSFIAFHFTAMTKTNNLLL